MEEFKKKGYYPAGGRSQTSSAGSITYVNTNSGLTAGNVQDAIDEVIDMSYIDGIIEEGTITTSDNIVWHYIKYKSGLVDILGETPNTVSVTPTAIMGGYFVPVNGKPLPFKVDTTKPKILTPKGTLGTGLTFAAAEFNGNEYYNTQLWGNQNAATAKYIMFGRYYILDKEV